MAAVIPVHPDDVEQLLKIRRYLIGFRITNGWTQQDLSHKLGNKWVYDLEANDTWSWRFSRLQSWVEPFGLTLDAELEMRPSITRRVHQDPDVEPLFSLSRRTYGDWKTWQRAYLTAGLRSARQHMNLSGKRVSARMGMTDRAILNWEREGDEIMLPAVLRYARALEGRVRLGVREPG